MPAFPCTDVRWGQGSVWVRLYHDDTAAVFPGPAAGGFYVNNESFNKILTAVHQVLCGVLPSTVVSTATNGSITVRDTGGVVFPHGVTLSFEQFKDVLLARYVDKTKESA